MYPKAKTPKNNKLTRISSHKNFTNSYKSNKEEEIKLKKVTSS